MPASRAASLNHPAASSDHDRVILERYTPLVRRVAGALQRSKPPVLENDDVFQDGMLGLLRAIRSHRTDTDDPRFAAYAGAAIRSAIIDGYRSASLVSRGEYARAKQTREAHERGEAVSATDVATAHQTLAHAWFGATDINDESALGMTLSDPLPGPEQRCSENQLLRRAVDVLQAQPVRDRSIFIACEFEGESRVAVARRHRLSASRITQIVHATRLRILDAIG